MKKTIKFTAAVAMIGLMAFASAGCGGDDKKAAAAKDTLKFGVTNFADSLEPTDNYFGWIVMRYGLGECLVKFDEKMNSTPWLAENWQVSDDKLTWTFKINDKAKFSNGNKVTAEAVKKSIERTFEKAARARAMFEYDNISADGQTLMIKTHTPVATLPGMLGDPLFIIIDTSVTDRDYAKQGPICTGPYMVNTYSKAKAVMDANPNYWDGEVPFKHVEIPTIDDPNTRAMALQSGEIDMALLDPKNAENFKNMDGYSCYDMTTSDYRGIMFNFANDYWKENKDLIPAICYGIDRQAIIDAVLLGQGMPAYGPLQRNIYNYEDVEHYDYNPEKAKEILEAAGCEMGDDGFYYRDGEKVGFVISVSAGDQVRIDMAQIAAQELKEIGMDVSVEIPAQTDWAGQMAFLIGWGSPFDADDHTYKEFGTDKGANYSSYSNEEVDKYLTEARQSADPEVRKEAYANFQKALAEDPAYAMICYIDANYVADSNIKGINPDTIMGHHGVGIFWNVADWTIE